MTKFYVDKEELGTLSLFSRETTRKLLLSVVNNSQTTHGVRYVSNMSRD